MKCVVCDSQDTFPFLRFERNPKVRSSWGVPSVAQTIYKCRTCALQFTDRQVSMEEEEGMYDQSYQETMAGAGGESEKATGAPEQSQLRVDLVKKYAASGDLLDVGCSTGIFLEKAREAGFSVWGLDLSEYACQASRTRLGLGEDRIIQSGIAGAAILDQKKFDIITAWDVIEHCAQPREDLARMAAALKPGGVLVLRTPNTSSIFFQTALWLSRATLGRVKFPLLSLYHSDHLVYFNPQSLGRMLERAGLQVEASVADPLLWKRFRYCECRRGPLVNAGIGSLYFLGRAVGSGHGFIAVARA